MGLYRNLRNTCKKVLNPVLKPFRLGKVVMFHEGRSGSTVLGTMLGKHPKIYWGHEIFLSTKLEKRFPRGYRHFRDVIQNAEYRAGLGYGGFEIKFSQLRQIQIDKRDFVAEVKALGYRKYIVLRRLNSLRRATSSNLIPVRGAAHLRVGEAVTKHQTTLDAAKLPDIFDREMKDFAELRQLLEGMECLYLTYEDDILPDPLIAYRKVCNFLDVAPQNIAPSLQRTNPFPLRELIINYNEVAAVLRRTPYAWMLEESE